MGILYNFARAHFAPTLGQVGAPLMPRCPPELARRGGPDPDDHPEVEEDEEEEGEGARRADLVPVTPELDVRGVLQ